MLRKCCIVNKKKCNREVYLLNICLNHFKLKNHKYIVCIQSHFKGYKCRKYLKLYKVMPLDIQLKIKDYMNMDLYYNKYKKNLNLIINNYVKNIHNYDKMENSSLLINEVIKGFYLYKKYINIININNLKHMMLLGNQIYKNINNHINNIAIYNYEILNKININNINKEDLKKLKSEIMQLKIIYYKKYYNINSLFI